MISRRERMATIAGMRMLMLVLMVLAPLSLLTTHVEGAATTSSTNNSANSVNNPLSNPVALQPDLTVQYRVLNMDTGAATNANAIEFVLTYQGSGWLALGTNPAGRAMPGSEVILGKPLEATNSNSANANASATIPQNPAKYSITGYSSNSVQLMSSAQQTLRDASITEQNGSTVLQFTKLLNEQGEHPIDPSSVNSFVYAVGMSSSYPSIHQLGTSQQFSLDLSAAQGQPIAGASKSGPSGTTIFIAHGIMAVIAWAFLAPMAAAASSLRDLFPQGPIWFKTHMYMNITATLLMIVSFLVAVIYGRATFDEKHFVAGWVLFFAVLGQATMGAMRPDINPNAKDGFGGWWEQMVLGNKRAIWEAAHKILGWSLLALAMWQMYTGLQLLSSNYGTKDYTTAYWGWMIAFWAVVGIAEIFVYVKDEKSVEDQEEKAHAEQSTKEEQIANGIADEAAA